MIQDKAQFAVNGCSLNKNCNAVLSYLWTSESTTKYDAVH